MTSFWLRALPEHHVMVSGARGTVTLHPGQACAFDDSPQHQAIVAEVRAGRAPVELVEADVDPSLAPPAPDESELEVERAAHNAAVKTAAHTRLLQADAPPMPGKPLEGWEVVDHTPAEEPPPAVDEVRRLQPSEIPSGMTTTDNQED